MIAEASHQELISEITFAFGKLMRYSLSREYLVPVSIEIDMTQQYVSIQEKRLVSRFDVEWELCELDENGDALNLSCSVWLKMFFHTM